MNSKTFEPQTEREAFREELIESFRLLTMLYDINDPKVQDWMCEELDEFIADLRTMRAEGQKNDWVSRALTA